MFFVEDAHRLAMGGHRRFAPSLLPLDGMREAVTASDFGSERRALRVIAAAPCLHLHSMDFIRRAEGAGSSGDRECWRDRRAGFATSLPGSRL